MVISKPVPSSTHPLEIMKSAQARSPAGQTQQFRQPGRHQTGRTASGHHFPGNGELDISGNTLIQGPSLSAASGTGILHSSGVNLKIANSEIYQWSTGYWFRGTGSQKNCCAGVFISNLVMSQDEICIHLDSGNATFPELVYFTMSGGVLTCKYGIIDDNKPGWLADLAITGVVFTPGVGISTGAGTGIYLQQASRFAITGNVFDGGPTLGNNGIIIGQGASDGIIQGNVFNKGTIAAPISNSSVSVRVLDNPGYNPVGGSTVAVGPSPWTYTAGPSPETLYELGGTITSIMTSGVSVPIGSQNLGPFESVTITYTSVPNVSRVIH